METKLFATNKTSILIVGSNGLLGQSVADAAQHLLGEDVRFRNRVEHRRDEVACAFRELASTQNHHPMTVFFCHGSKGFSMRDEDRQIEEAQFRVSCRKIREARERGTGKVVLVSSLGCYLSQEKSPYKELVRHKELTLEELFGIDSLIARVPSIYGRHGSRRTGLIGTMIENTLKGKVTTIYGSSHTRRNYLEAAACGRALFTLGTTTSRNTIETMTHAAICCSRSHSITEIIAIIRRTLGKQPLVEFRHGETVHRENHIIKETSAHKMIMIDSNIQAWATKERSR